MASWLLFLWLFFLVWRLSMQLPQDVMDLLGKAEDDLAAAGTADTAHQQTVDALTLATKAEADANQASLDAHKTSVASAQAALDALKKHFGLS
jgi:hypothetical protein